MKRLSLALSLGLAGGALFAWASLPMPWMLGSMVFCLFGSLAKLPVAVPSWMRSPMIAVIGSLLGSSFSPALLDEIAGWWVAVIGLVLFMVFCAMACVSYFYFIARYDARTAYFCGMPGGVVEMSLLGEQYGADVSKIALVHSARIVLVVIAVPVIVRLFTGQDLSGVGSGGHDLANISVLDLGWFVFTCVAGAGLGVLLKFPASFLLGPMLLSCLLHLSGISSFYPPYELVVAAQVVLGCSIGCRFFGVSTKSIVVVLGYSLGSTGLLLGITCLFSWGLEHLGGYPFLQTLLAYSPGGLTEMGLLALVMNVEVAFVTTHHILRVLLVTLCAGAYLKWQHD